MESRCLLFLVVASTGCGSAAPDLDVVRAQMAPEQSAVGDPVVNSVGMALVPIPAGEFQMGSPPPKPEDSKKTPARKNEPSQPRHTVTITKPFMIGVCEVTQAQYEAVMGARPWEEQPLVEHGASHAATYVSWDDAVEFCRKLSETEGIAYRLPTEAEWEYACRAGTTTDYSFGDDASQLEEHAWFHSNAYAADEQYAHPVGQKLPNAWSLYDMHGNAWEWCQDWYGPFGEADLFDPTGPETGRDRVWRGGGFADPAMNVKSTTRLSHGRENYRPEFVTGFRVVRSMERK